MSAKSAAERAERAAATAAEESRKVQVLQKKILANQDELKAMFAQLAADIAEIRKQVEPGRIEKIDMLRSGKSGRAGKPGQGA